jgi:hypothetical protein
MAGIIATVTVFAVAQAAVYGAALGSAEERIASLITCFIAGNAVLQILLGRVAEQFGST